MRLVFKSLLILGLFALSAGDAQGRRNAANRPAPAVAEGLKYYNAGDYRNAIVQFLSAYKKDHNYRHLYYVAVSQSRLNNFQQAITFYNRYVQEGGAEIPPNAQASINAEIERLRAVAEQRYRGQSTHGTVSPPQRPPHNPVKVVDPQAEYRAATQAESIRNAKLEQEKRKQAEKKATEGRKFVSGNKLTRAADAFERAYAFFPNPVYLYEKALVVARMNDHEAALDLLNRYLAETKGSISKERENAVHLEIQSIKNVLEDAKQTREAEGRLELGKTLIEKHEYGRALNELAISYKLKPGAEALYQLARAQEGSGQFKDAKKSYEQYLATNDKKIARRKHKSILKSIERIEKLEQQELSKKHSQERNAAGRKLASIGQHERALQTYGQAYAHFPNPDILFNIGESAAALKKYDMAVDAYSQFLKGAGDNLRENRRNSIEKTISRLQSASQEAQNRQTAASLLESGQSNNKHRNYEKALKDFQAAYSVFPEYTTLYHIAVTQSLLRRNTDAIATYEQYLSDGRGQIARDTRRLVSQEIKRLKRYLEAVQARDESDRLFKAGLTFVAKKDYEHAIEEFQSAYTTAPNYEILYPMAQADMALERKAEALEAYKQYLSLGGGRIPQKRRLEVREEIQRLLETTSAE